MSCWGRMEWRGRSVLWMSKKRMSKNMMRCRIWIFSAGVLLGSTGAWAQNPPPGRGRGPARFLGAEAGVPGHVVKNAPYSADTTTETTQTLPDGNHIRQTSSSHVYRDSEGRTRTEIAQVALGAIAPNSSLPRMVFVQDPVAGTSYALDTVDKTATRSAWPGRGRGPGAKGPGPAADAGGRRGPGPGTAGKTESLGRQTMEGVPVDGTRITSTIPAGQIGNEQPIQTVTEHWYSPELQIYLLTRHSDPRSGETVTRVTNLSRGEPAKSLFEVPVDYNIISGGGHTAGAATK